MNAAIANGDATAIAALYTESAKLVPDGAPRIDGRGEATRAFAEAVDLADGDFLFLDRAQLPDLSHSPSGSAGV